MKKKKSSGGGANWMDTYGDMVTLLLCFFVLLYSMSTISQENWRAIVLSFNPFAEEVPKATSGNDGAIADPDVEPGKLVVPDVTLDVTAEDVEKALEQLFQSLKDYAAEQNMEQSINVVKDGLRVYVTFNETAFFDGNSPELRRDAYPILDAVCGALDNAAQYIDEVQIQGHTAQAERSEPNNVRTDRTLASNRATNVLIYVQQSCEVDPARLLSVGMGQWHPVDTNDTPEGRAANRRVEFIISGVDVEAMQANLGEGNIEHFELADNNS